MIELYDSQLEAIQKLRTGSILCGGVGSGKSRTALAYYFLKVCGGQLKINGVGDTEAMVTPMDLYIITTARKRDTGEWEEEAAPFLIGRDRETSINHVKMVVDSWNNVGKYTEVTGAFFIFDEQRVVGTGKWSKAFLKITKHNPWILLSATPGDQWTDYLTVFLANGFYKHKSDFEREHVVYSRFCTKYPRIERYTGEAKLERLRRQIVVEMPLERDTISHHLDICAPYDRDKYKQVMRQRWNPFANEPIEQVAELCYVLRRVTNDDPRRIAKVMDIVAEHPRSIIFYNFDYELELLREMAKKVDIPCAEWNGHHHELIPTTERWVYLVQYAAGAEGWNCTQTDTMIFYSQTYSYKQLVQAAGRINRMNTKYIDLYYYHLYSNAAIDLAIRHALNMKQNFNERLFFRE